MEKLLEIISSIPTYVYDLVIIALLIIAFFVGFLKKSKFIIVTMLIFGVVLIVSYFALFSTIKNFIDVKLVTLINNGQDLDAGLITIKTDSLQSIFGSLYDSINEISLQFGSTISISKEVFVATADALSGGISMFILVLGDFIVSIILGYVFIFILKLIPKKKSKKKSYRIVGGVLNLAFVFFIITVTLYFVSNLTSTAYEITQVTTGVTEELDKINLITDQLTTVSTSLDTFKNHYSYIMNDEFLNTVTSLQQMVEQIKEYINQYTSTNAELYQQIKSIDTILQNIKDSLTNLLNNFQLTGFMFNIDYGYFSATLSDGTTIKFSNNIGTVISDTKTIIFDLVNDYYNNADKLLTFTNKFIQLSDQAFGAMGF